VFELLSAAHHSTRGRRSEPRVPTPPSQYRMGGMEKVTVEDWHARWFDEEGCGWEQIPKQEAEADATVLPTGTGPAAVTGPVATAAATGATSAAPGSASAAVGLALPPSHGGYRGGPKDVIEFKDVVAALPAKTETLTLANIPFKERRGQTRAAGTIQRYALIPEHRAEEFIAGEEEREGVSFSRNKHGACGIYSSRVTLQCHRGPANNAKSAMEMYQAMVATRAAASASGKTARTGTKVGRCRLFLSNPR